MYTTNYSRYILRKSDSNLVAFTASLAAICFVVCVVNLGIGEGKLPKGLRNTANYFIAGTVLFTALCFVIYFMKRFRIIVTGENLVLTVEVKDPKLTTPLIIQSPFKFSAQWTFQLGGRGPKMKLLYLTILSEKNEALVTFEGALGAAYDAPRRFDYVDILNGGRILVAEKKYSAGKLTDMADEIMGYLNYIDKKKV